MATENVILARRWFEEVWNQRRTDTIDERLTDETPQGDRQHPHVGRAPGQGRAGIYEVMTVSSEIRRLALERRAAEDLREVAVQQGMRRLREDGLDKVRQGRTSIAELSRVLGTG